MAPQKSVLITGSSKGGIGDFLAQEFHKKGLLVFATARNLTKVEHLKDQGIYVLPLDVIDEKSIHTAVESVRAVTGGKLDFLVNNSGGGYSMPLLDSNLSTAKQVFDVNVFALVSVTQAFSPLLTASQGTVVNIGSVLGHTPFPWSGWYNASKAAVNLLTDQMRIEFAPLGVKVVLIVAGAIRTNFLNNLPSAPHLPADTVYAAARTEIEAVMSGQGLEEGAMDGHAAVQAIVGNVLKSSPKKRYWIGGGASLIWTASTFGWSTVWDTLFSNLAKLPVVRKKILADRKLG